MEQAEIIDTFGTYQAAKNRKNEKRKKKINKKREGATLLFLLKDPHPCSFSICTP